jgi:hypothetical protein
MKYIYSIIIILGISIHLFNSCKKHGILSGQSQFSNNDIITDPDAKTCVCCGGLMITFDSLTQHYADNFKLIKKKPRWALVPTISFRFM